MTLPTGMFIDIDYFPQGHYENLIHKIILVDDEGNRYKSSGSARMNPVSNGGESYHYSEIRVLKLNRKIFYKK